MEYLKTEGYYDLNINIEAFNDDCREIALKYLYSFGYRTIAINHSIDDRNLETNKKKKGRDSLGAPDCLPKIFDIELLKACASKLGLSNFTFLTRLTIIFSNRDNIQKIIKSPNFKKFDLIAVTPVTHTAFMFTCSNLDADILSYDPENKISLKLSRKLYFQLVDKGYHFELLYSPAIQDASKRKNLIHLSHLYHSLGKSKNVIVSSGAEHHYLIRSPYDIISLGQLFGLNELQSKNAVLHSTRNVVVNAVGRRHGKAVMLVENLEPEVSIQEALCAESSDEDMNEEEPAQKKSKV
ncbi:ribonuclease P protein subunit Rpp30 [Rhynchophorus ferrugineus]|uniref:ribonuclease P protein subunit Rpp30 n=1 Tax=Rhynchophorus ferrugineus TaxID=354439 RepID=UPI003FCDF7CA